MAGYHLSNSDATHLPSSQNYITRPAQASVTPSRITADESAAPELDRAFEGLQVDPNGPYPYPTIYGADSKAKYWVPPRADAEKQYWNGEEGLILQEEASQRRSPRIWCLPKRTFTVVSVVVLVMICIAIGGGVGGYYANKRSTSAPIPDSDAWDSSDSRSVPVTSGTTGMASLPCHTATVSPSTAPQATPRNIPNPYDSPSGDHAQYEITCRRGAPDVDHNQISIDTIRRFITYNFTECIAHCSDFKNCGGVVYNANLTGSLADGEPGGNCLLKNARFEPTSIRKHYVASAIKKI